MAWLKVERADVAAFASDPALLGRWTLLLALYEDSHPHLAALPRWATDAVLAAFADRLVIEGDLYRVPSVDADRETLIQRRAEETERKRVYRLSHGTSRVTSRVTSRDLSASPSRRTSVARHSPSPSHVETSLVSSYDSTSDVNAREIFRDVERLTQQPYAVQPSTKMGDKLDALVLRHGLEAVRSSFEQIASMLDKPPTVQQLIFGAGDVLDPIPKVRPMTEDEEVADYLRRTRVSH